ncbi:hypothetical protein C8R44DRAFT_747020 [Mycena epipterygia]|nr:hypothetical protein C8R44DRAFT_747020 [Mycena epipterygia]
MAFSWPESMSSSETLVAGPVACEKGRALAVGGTLAEEAAALALCEGAERLGEWTILTSKPVRGELDGRGDREELATMEGCETTELDAVFISSTDEGYGGSKNPNTQELALRELSAPWIGWRHAVMRVGRRQVAADEEALSRNPSRVKGENSPDGSSHALYAQGLSRP